jgi:hypothetical protein
MVPVTELELRDLPPKTEPVLMLDCKRNEGGQLMVRKAFKPEQIINKLSEAIDTFGNLIA